MVAGALTPVRRLGAGGAPPSSGAEGSPGRPKGGSMPGGCETGGVGSAARVARRAQRHHPPGVIPIGRVEDVANDGYAGCRKVTLGEVAAYQRRIAIAGYRQ